MAENKTKATEASVELLAKLGKHTIGKGCLYVRKLSDVDLNLLEHLIVGVVAERKHRYGERQSGA